jgi:hypothetical protein
MRAAALWFMAIACQGGAAPGHEYELDVSGAVSVHERGPADSASAGTSDAPWFTITLGGLDGTAAAVFTRATALPPEPGTYEIGELALQNGGFRALVVTGLPARPTGVFWAWSGTLRIMPAAPGALAGEFELRALGYRTDAVASPWQSVTSRGQFRVPLHDRTPGPGACMTYVERGASWRN